MTEGRSAPAMDWPKTADEATADRMIVCAAHHAVFLDARHDDLYAAVPWHEPAESQERTAAIRRWANAIGETVKAAQVVALLVEIQERHRDDADAIARRLWEMTEAGDWLIEPLWDHLAARGVDASAVYREAQAAAKGASS